MEAKPDGVTMGSVDLLDSYCPVLRKNKIQEMVPQSISLDLIVVAAIPERLQGPRDS